MDNGTYSTEVATLPAGMAAPGRTAPRHAVPRHAAAPQLGTPSLAAEVRATLLLFGMVLLVILGFGLASTIVLRLLAS